MFSTLVKKLNAAGLTEAQIVDAVRRIDPTLSTRQPTINRIKLGRQKTLDYPLGAALVKLGREHGIEPDEHWSEPPSPIATCRSS